MLGSYLKRFRDLGNRGVGRVGWASAFLKIPHMILLDSQLGDPADLYHVTSCSKLSSETAGVPGTQQSPKSLALVFGFRETGFAGLIWDAGLQGSQTCPS